MKLCVKPVINVPFGWCQAWLWIYFFFFAFIARRSPWHPTWHKRESAFCLCQRLSRNGARLLHPASPPSRALTHSASWGGWTCVQKMSKNRKWEGGYFFPFFPVAAVTGIAATVNMRLNKETWQKLGESICMSRYGPERHRSEISISCHCHFFFPTKWMITSTLLHQPHQGGYWLNE